MNLLTAKDVAQKLGVCTLTVIRLANHGTLAAVEVHRGEKRRILRFRAETVEKFISDREKHGTAPISKENKKSLGRRETVH